MADVETHYLNLTWPQFAVCNDDATGAFEDMARCLFSLEFLGSGTIPHSDHNNQGVVIYEAVSCKSMYLNHIS